MLCEVSRLRTRSTAKIKINDETKEDKTVEKTINDGKKETTKNVTIETKYNVENSKKLVDNTGLYEIEITANESNPYKIKAENNKSVIEISSESTTGIHKDFIKSLTKEKD